MKIKKLLHKQCQFSEDARVHNYTAGHNMIYSYVSEILATYLLSKVLCFRSISWHKCISYNTNVNLQNVWTT